MATFTTPNRSKKFKTPGSVFKELKIVWMDHCLNGIDVRMVDKRAKGMAQHRLTVQWLVLFGHIAAETVTAPGADD